MMPVTVAERSVERFSPLASSEQVTQLRAARHERGWSLKQLVRLLWEEAERQEVRIGTHPASVKSLLISWELGRRTPRAIYVKLLTALYGTTAEALGLPEPKTFSLDDERLAGLFANHHGFVRGWLFKRIGDRHLADDLTSETFIRMGEVLARESEGWMPENPYRFLAALARHTVADYYAYRAPKHERFFGEYEDGKTRDFPATDALSRPEETVTGALSVLDLVAGLSEHERELIVLRFFDGLSVTEIVKRNGGSITHTRRLLTKALAIMRANAVVVWDIPATVGALETAA